MVSISVGRLLAKRIIISMEIPLQLVLLRSSCIVPNLAVQTLRTNKRASAELELIPTVDDRISESCKLSTDEKQIRFFHGSWKQIHIRLVGFGQKYCALVYSINSTPLELLFHRLYFDSTPCLLHTFSADCSVLNLLQYTHILHLCSGASVSLQQSDR